MRCPTTQQLAEYQLETSSARATARIHRHVAECPRCRAEMSALQQTCCLLEALPSPALPDTLWAGVAERLQPAPRRMSAHCWKMAAGLGVAAMVLCGFLANRPQQPALPADGAYASSYVIEHELLASQDSLADRAALGARLIVPRGKP